MTNLCDTVTITVREDGQIERPPLGPQRRHVRWRI